MSVILDIFDLGNSKSLGQATSVNHMQEPPHVWHHITSHLRLCLGATILLERCHFISRQHSTRLILSHVLFLLFEEGTQVLHNGKGSLIFFLFSFLKPSIP